MQGWESFLVIQRLLVVAALMAGILCFQVVSGYKYRHHLMPNCSKCVPGTYVFNRCSVGQDTECAPCPDEHYTHHHNLLRRCYPCSRCGPGLFVAHPCSETRDTVCDSCHTVKGPHNTDYEEKCVLQNYTGSDEKLEEVVQEAEVQSRNSLNLNRFRHDDDLKNVEHGEQDSVPYGGYKEVQDYAVPERANMMHLRHEDTHHSEIPQEMSVHHHHHHSPPSPDIGLAYTSTTIVLGVVSTCVLAGLLVVVVLSRWRTNKHKKEEKLYWESAVPMLPTTFRASEGSGKANGNEAVRKKVHFPATFVLLQQTTTAEASPLQSTDTATVSNCAYGGSAAMAAVKGEKNGPSVIYTTNKYAYSLVQDPAEKPEMV